MANEKGHLIKMPPRLAATRFVNIASVMTGADIRDDDTPQSGGAGTNRTTYNIGI
jgi:hypothetical protein